MIKQAGEIHRCAQKYLLAEHNNGISRNLSFVSDIFNIKIINCPSTPFGSRQRDMNFEFFFSSHFPTPTKNYPTMVFVVESVITEIIPIGKLHLVFDLLPHILVMGYFLLAVACLASTRFTSV